jgi:hypothetical protein
MRLYAGPVYWSRNLFWSFSEGNGSEFPVHHVLQHCPLRGCLAHCLAVSGPVAAGLQPGDVPVAACHGGVGGPPPEVRRVTRDVDQHHDVVVGRLQRLEVFPQASQRGRGLIVAQLQVARDAMDGVQGDERVGRGDRQDHRDCHQRQHDALP